MTHTSSNTLAWIIVVAMLCLTPRSHAQIGGINVLLKEDMRLRIVDNSGNPVSMANIRGGVHYGGRIDDYIPFNGVSDTNGFFTVKISVGNEMIIGCKVTKAGYYPSELTIPYSEWHGNSSDGQKDYSHGRKIREIALKRILEPAKLCVFKENLHYAAIPKLGEWIGLDLKMGEWVSPFGDGVCPDILLKFSSYKKGIHNYHFGMEVSFTNNPFAGAYIMKKDKMSVFQTAYNADSNAAYKSSFYFYSEQKPGDRKIRKILDADSYLVFRTRTRIDEDGRLLSAHYGIIIGRWLSESATMILSDGCFNPISNDLNIEDGRNLRIILNNAAKKGATIHE